MVSKHLHMMFRNQTEVLDQYPEHFETSKLRQPTKKGQVYFGRFYLGKCNRARLRYNGAGPWSLKRANDGTLDVSHRQRAGRICAKVT